MGLYYTLKSKVVGNLSGSMKQRIKPCEAFNVIYPTMKIQREKMKYPQFQIRF